LWEASSGKLLIHQVPQEDLIGAVAFHP
jgi:hypothetical protein